MELSIRITSGAAVCACPEPQPNVSYLAQTPKTVPVILNCLLSVSMESRLLSRSSYVSVAGSSPDQVTQTATSSESALFIRVRAVKPPANTIRL